MLYKLSYKNKEELLNLPETGFGYQRITAVLKDTTIRQNYIVFNAEIAIEENKDLNFYTNTLIGYCYQMLLDSLSEIEFSGIQLLANVNNAKLNLTNTEKGKNDKVFVRPTIYQNDNRINEKENYLIPGSCITTSANYKEFTKKDRDVFNAFSLPKQEEVKKIFHFIINDNEIKPQGNFEGFFGKQGGGEKYIATQNARIISKEIVHSFNIQCTTSKFLNISSL